MRMGEFEPLSRSNLEGGLNDCAARFTVRAALELPAPPALKSWTNPPEIRIGQCRCVEIQARHNSPVLQSIEKLQQPITGSEAAGPGIKWYRFGERCLLQSDVCIQVFLRGLDRLMPQPECDD